VSSRNEDGLSAAKLEGDCFVHRAGHAWDKRIVVFGSMQIKVARLRITARGARLRTDARGDGGVREELAKGVRAVEANTTIVHFNLGAEIAQLRLQSQAGTVLVSAAALDGLLRSVLLVVMNLSNNKAERMFDGPVAPLYHFSPKIEIAYAFKVIDEDLYNDLRIIKDVRNKFADPEGLTDFQTPKITELVRKFKSWTSTSDDYALFFQRVQHCLSELGSVGQRHLTAQSLSAEPKR
jgi:hypothetical protein